MHDQIYSRTISYSEEANTMSPLSNTRVWSTSHSPRLP